MAYPLYCTKIASRLVRTFTDRHGLARTVQGPARRRLEEGAADLGLGRGVAERGAAALCRLGRAAPARVAGAIGRDAGARGTRPSWRAAASNSFRHAPCLTWKAGPSRTFSRISLQRRRFGAGPARVFPAESEGELYFGGKNPCRVARDGPDRSRPRSATRFHADRSVGTGAAACGGRGRRRGLALWPATSMSAGAFWGRDRRPRTAGPRA